MNRFWIRLALLCCCVYLPSYGQRLPPPPAPSSSQKVEKSNVPMMVVKAQFVMVMSQREVEGNQRPDFEDVQTVQDVENAIHKWGRYKLVYRKEDADLVISVRRVSTLLGRMGAGGTVSSGDYLAVHNARPNISSSTLWRQAQRGGLATPRMPLVKSFQDDVEAAAAKIP